MHTIKTAMDFWLWIQCLGFLGCYQQSQRGPLQEFTLVECPVRWGSQLSEQVLGGALFLITRTTMQELPRACYWLDQLFRPLNKNSEGAAMHRTQAPHSSHWKMPTPGRRSEPKGFDEFGQGLTAESPHFV